MLIEILRPGALLLCILSLLGVFHAAFLVPASNIEERLRGGLVLLSLTACICILSGLLFREDASLSTHRQTRLLATLPVQIFLWATLVLVLLFACSWYLETYFVPYCRIRRW